MFARLDPHLIKLAHYVALWLVEGNQLFNSQTWAAGAGGAQRAAHLIPRTLISYKAKLQLSVSLPPPSFLNYCEHRTLGVRQTRRGEHDRWGGSKRSLFGRIPVLLAGLRCCGWRCYLLICRLDGELSIQETTRGISSSFKLKGLPLLFSAIKRRAIIRIIDSRFLISTAN